MILRTSGRAVKPLGKPDLLGICLNLRVFSGPARRPRAALAVLFSPLTSSIFGLFLRSRDKQDGAFRLWIGPACDPGDPVGTAGFRVDVVRACPGHNLISLADPKKVPLAGGTVSAVFHCAGLPALHRINFGELSGPRGGAGSLL